MPLDPNFQTVLQPNTLYLFRAARNDDGQLSPNIQVIGGTISIYDSQAFPGNPPNLALMDNSNASFTGDDVFASIPNYFYYTGSPTSVTVTGVQVTANPTA